MSLDRTGRGMPAWVCDSCGRPAAICRGSIWVRVRMSVEVAQPSGSVVARLHGAFNVVAGLWPLLHRRSFEAVFGPKQDYWLASTVALLLAGNGTVQLMAASTPHGLASARRIGAETALALASVDLVNVARGRISRTYLFDAAVELGWLWVWARQRSIARPSWSESLCLGWSPQVLRVAVVQSMFPMMCSTCRTIAI
jgi:hypothetical protein